MKEALSEVEDFKIGGRIINKVNRLDDIRRKYENRYEHRQFTNMQK